MVIPMNEAKHMMKTLQLVLASTAELIQSDFAVSRGNTSEKVKSATGCLFFLVLPKKLLVLKMTKSHYKSESESGQGQHL